MLCYYYFYYYAAGRHVRSLSEDLPGLFPKGTPVRLVEGMGRSRVVPTPVRIAQQEERARQEERRALEVGWWAQAGGVSVLRVLYFS